MKNVVLASFAALAASISTPAIAQGVFDLPIGDPARRESRLTPSLDVIIATADGAELTPAQIAERLVGTRLLLIGDNHTLHSDGVARFSDVGQAIRQAFIDRDGLDPDGLDAAIVGDTLVLIAHQAFIWWARHGEGEPGPVLEAAFDRVAEGFRRR